MKLLTKNQITVIIVLLLFCYTYNYAQNKPLRIEYPIEESYGHHVVPVKDNKKALVVSMTKDRSKKMYQWSFDLIDENLKTVKKTQVDFPLGFDTYKYDYYENHYYVLQYEEGKGDYSLLDLNMLDLTFKIQEGKLTKGLVFDEILAMDGFVFVSMGNKKGRSIFIINATTNDLQQIEPKELTDLKITYMDMQRVDNIKEEKEMVYKFKVCEKGGCDYMMLRFNNKGKQIGNFYFLPKADEERELTSISISKISSNVYLTTGTYSVAKSKLANGIYIARVNNEKVEFINYTNFLDLNNFTNYMGLKQREKLEKTKNKKEEQGEELNIGYNVVVHDIAVNDGEYFFLGEFYYPTYRTETRTVTYMVPGPNGTSRMATRQESYRVFDGFQYSHATVAGFDMLGKLNWSNTFEMSLSYKPFKAKEFIRMNQEFDNTKLVYATGSSAKITIFKKTQIIKEESVKSITTGDENDIIKYTTNTSIEWWYDDNYFGFGIQKIKNEENERGDKKREVFYINKIIY